MAKLHVLTAAVALAGSVAFAQTATTTERTEVQSSNGAATSRTSMKVTETQYVDQLRTVYTSAGVAQTKMERLVELDRQIYNAWIAGDEAAVRRYRQEQRAILGQDELQKVNVYFQSHPLPASYPEFIVNTWAPEGTFNPDISISGTRTGATGSSINIGSSTSNPSGATVNRSTQMGGAAISPGSGGSVSGSTSTDTSVSGSAGSGSSVGTMGTGSTTGAAGTSGASGTTGQYGSSSAGATGTMGGSTGGSTSGNTGATGQTGTGSSASGSGSSTGSASGGSSQ